MSLFSRSSRNGFVPKPRLQKSAKKPKRGRRDSGSHVDYRNLEPRQLLATVSLFADTLVIADATLGGSNDNLTVSYASGNYTINDPGLAMTTSIAGATGNGTNTVTIPDTGVDNIVFSTVGGNDNVTINSVQNSMGDLTVTGGLGADQVTINADITFASDAHLHVDLTNGSGTTDFDWILIGTDANLELSGEGSATLVGNYGVLLNPGASIVTVDGDQTLVSNNGHFNFPSLDVPKTIADNATTTSQLGISGDFPIKDLTVTLDIDHFFAADLDVFLIHPDGSTRVELFSDVGGGNDNFKNLTLDDDAPVAITSNNTPVPGVFRPEGSLSDFNGMTLDGSWTLEITDDAGGDVGTLNSWSINTVVSGAQATLFGIAKGIGFSGALLETTGTGDINIDGRGTDSAAAQNLNGVDLSATTLKTSSTSNPGSININGVGGNGASSNYGVLVSNSSSIESGAQLNVLGDVEGTDSSNHGVFVGGSSLLEGLNGLDVYSPRNIHVETNSNVNTLGGNLSLAANLDLIRSTGDIVGVQIDGSVRNFGAGDLVIVGTGGTAGVNRNGIVVGSAGLVQSTGSLRLTGLSQTSSSTAVKVSGDVTSNSTSEGIIFRADTIDIQPTANITATADQQVSFELANGGTAIDLGGADVLGSLSGGSVLGLTDAELDRVTAGVVQIGDHLSGTITVSAPITHDNDLSLTTAGGIDVFQGITMAVDKDFTATSTSTTDRIALWGDDADILATGIGAIEVTAARDIQLQGGSITVEDGNLTLSANQQATPTPGDFDGIGVYGGLVQSTGSGEVTPKEQAEIQAIIKLGSLSVMVSNLLAAQVDR